MELREVLFKRLIPPTKGSLISGRQWEDEFKHSGVFHRWVVVDGEIVALIECEDGTIIQVMSSKLKFVKPIVINKLFKDSFGHLLRQLGYNKELEPCTNNIKVFDMALELRELLK